MSLGGQRLDAARYQVVPRTLVFAFRDRRVLLQQVPSGRGAWAGLWNGIGGHVERGESTAGAARREFREETGLELRELHLAAEVIVDLGGSPGIGVSVFAGQAAEGAARPSAEGEVRWFSLEEALESPLVEDLPTLLPHVMAFVDGGRAFTAVYRYDSEGHLIIDMD
ncbi:MAG TPA: NUDIX domain-containing protein [Anaerolineales bacterium]|nr:NUDIX domain-containing protein [Anaerolineales bacterium]